LIELISKYAVLINFLLEISCMIKIIETFTEKKRNNNVQYAIIIIILGLSVYINFYQGNKKFQILYYVGLFFIFKLRYEMSYIKTIIGTLISFMMVGALELIICIPYNLAFYFLRTKNDYSILITLTVFGVCCWINKNRNIIVSRQLIDSYKEKINVKYLIVFIVLFFFFVMAVIRFKKELSWGEGIYLPILFLVYLISAYKISIYQAEINCHKQYGEQYGNVVMELRERQHKFMNQVDSIYALCKIYNNYDELVMHQIAELDTLKKYMMPEKLLILERPLVISHIYTKLCESEDKNINIHIDFSCSLEDVEIPDIFLIEIIGNLLDNAMDEVMERKKNEDIRFKITNNGDEICFLIANEHDKISYKEYQNFFKEGYSRKGGGRGVGLPYVKKIVDKFHGHIEIGNKKYGINNYFTISVYLKK